MKLALSMDIGCQGWWIAAVIVVFGLFLLEKMEKTTSSTQEKDEHDFNLLCEIEATLDISFEGDVQSPAFVKCMEWKHVNVASNVPNENKTLNAKAYKHNTITLQSNGHMQTFRRKCGFNAQDILDCLLILEKKGRVNNLEDKDSIDIDHIYFEGLKYDVVTNTHIVFWGS